MDFGMFGIVSKTLLNSMNWLHAKLGSYAAAIIVLTLIIKSAAVAAAEQGHEFDEADAGAPAEDDGASGEVQGRPDADEHGGDEALQGLRHQSAQRLPADARPDPDLLRLLQHARKGRGTAEQRASSGCTISRSRTPSGVHRRRHRRSISCRCCMAATMFWQMAISPKSGDPDAAADLHVHAADLHLLLLQLRLRAWRFTGRCRICFLSCSSTRRGTRHHRRCRKSPRRRRRNSATTFPMSLNPRETLDTMLGLLGFVVRDQGIRARARTDPAGLHGGKGAPHRAQWRAARRHPACCSTASCRRRTSRRRRCRSISSTGARCRTTASRIASGRSPKIVRQTGRSYQLEPMNAYERRIVHNGFQGRSGGHDLEPAGRCAAEAHHAAQAPAVASAIEIGLCWFRAGSPRA